VHAGCPVVGNAWMTVDLARTASRRDGLVLADAVLRRGTGRQALEAVLLGIHGQPGARNASWVIEHADHRAETPLESLGRLACIEGGLPVPLSNVWVGDGFPLYRFDHLWPYHWAAAEGDGALKYTGGDAAVIINAEKEREWALRRLGLDIVRYSWELAEYRRDELTARFRAVLAASPARPEPIQWWPIQNPFVGQDGRFADEQAEWRT
jgi:hypothetical protein